MPTFLKIDVEGAGADVLAGCRQILDKAAPSIYIELHNKKETEAVKVELQTRGYLIETVDGKSVSDPTVGDYAEFWCYKKN
jgi:hypothetical protein